MKSSPAFRRGMSIVEFVGYLSAMVGGVVLGSMYLGVDVKQMSVAVLKQAGVVNVPEKDAAEASPATADAEDAAQDATPADVAAEETAPSTGAAATVEKTDKPTTQTEPPAPAEAPANVQTPVPPAAPNTLAGLLSREDFSLTDEQRRTLTRAYWEALDECMKNEVKHRLAGLPEDGNWQLFDYLTCRKKGHVEATGFMKQLDLRGVDDHVSTYAKKALSWHQDGVKLYGRALDLLTDAPSAQLSGPFAQSWQSAATQHQMEERLLGEKHQAVEAYLKHTFDSDPAVTEPPAEAAAADAAAKAGA